MPRVVFFEIKADDPERAGSFYEQVFGWRFEKFDAPYDYWLITTSGSGENNFDGGMMRPADTYDASVDANSAERARIIEENRNVNIIRVEDIDSYIPKIEEAGGIIIMPKHAIPNIGWLFYFKDTEGNVFCVMEWSCNAE
ncbi:VOC family protein [candidate division WOR-3 bacterium]|uniref:VOC family protein n=1 Tax=candidate division WOR-3 bacterium TaxID=2052148 RepID=A0A9D5QC16_UNCW3|nr:VOC family protein [candidate division WOR-3 bacterium]MBD3364049.1 VOC family protein [candidate division WOR-3 bacterium]